MTPTTLAAYLEHLVGALDSDALLHLRCAVVEAESMVTYHRQAQTLRGGYYCREVLQLAALADVHLEEMRRHIALLADVTRTGVADGPAASTSAPYLAAGPSEPCAPALTEGLPRDAGAGAPSVNEPAAPLSILRPEPRR